MVRIAAAAYRCDYLGAWDAYEAKIARWVAEAAGQGAELLVFPEYGGMELATFDGEATAAGLRSAIDAQTRWMPRADALHARLARKHGVHICAGSVLARRADGSAVNRACFFTPDGAVGIQDKLVLVRYEREVLDLSPGSAARVFDTALGRIGIPICYDVEFPLIARAMVEAGAQILLAPSCTETARGYWRVRIGAQARALEQQCVTVQSVVVGEAPWSEIIDVSTGAAAVYGPPDRGFPDDGVIGLGEMDVEGWLYAEADLAQAAEVRRDGGVLNMTHWAEQQDGRLERLETIDLCRSSNHTAAE